MRAIFGVGCGFDRDGKPLDAVEVLVRDAMTHASRLHGGCFVQRGQGGWVDPASDDLVIEPGITITIDGIEPEQAREFAEYLKFSFRQTSVLLTLQHVDEVALV